MIYTANTGCYTDPLLVHVNQRCGNFPTIHLAHGRHRNQSCVSIFQFFLLLFNLPTFPLLFRLISRSRIAFDGNAEYLSDVDRADDHYECPFRQDIEEVKNGLVQR